ncbi:hypothetical protein [Burkholderia alba]|uniref:hypothetical protein n=1 Tax=Burkholderia alba TaxID=2683677 RepID=UPI002B05A12B|nr:hypothetical protein [Burkholderia alba]
MKWLLYVALICGAVDANAAQGIDVVVCGAKSETTVDAQQVPCKLSDGSTGVQQVAHLTLVNGGVASETPINGGVDAGAAVGSAVFLVLAIAFGLRSLRRFIESASES